MVCCPLGTKPVVKPVMTYLIEAYVCRWLGAHCGIFIANTWEIPQSCFKCLMNISIKYWGMHTCITMLWNVYSNDQGYKCHLTDGLVQERCTSSALAIELRLSFINPLICRVNDDIYDRMVGYNQHVIVILVNYHCITFLCIILWDQEWTYYEM